MRTVHFMDGFGQQIIKNIKIWTAGQMKERPSVEAWSNLRFIWCSKKVVTFVGGWLLMTNHYSQNFFFEIWA